MSGLVAGIGFRRGTQGSEIVALIRAALAEAALNDRLTVLATAADRAGDAAIREAAAAFGLVPVPVDEAALAAVDRRVPTRSARIERLRGVGSLAEAAALAAAGRGGRLALARIQSAGATCALALTDDATASMAQDGSREPRSGPLSQGERAGVRGVTSPDGSRPSPCPSPAKGAGPARHPVAERPGEDAAPPIPSGRDAAAAAQPTRRKRP